MAERILETWVLEDTKKLGDAEARDRASLLSKFKSLSTEVSYNLHSHWGCKRGILTTSPKQAGK